MNQDERPATGDHALLRLGAVCAILGSVVVFAARAAHGDLPTDVGADALGHVAAHPNYVLVHLSANLGVLAWAGGLVLLASSLRHHLASAVGRLGAASALVGAAVYLVDFSVDGYALRDLANTWLAASAAERADIEAAALVVLVALGGPSLSAILTMWGVAVAVYAVAVTLEGYPRWLGWTGVIVGAAIFVTGIAQFLQPGFVLGLVVYAALPLVAQLWSVALGAAMWRRAGTDTRPTADADRVARSRPAGNTLIRS